MKILKSRNCTRYLLAVIGPMLGLAPVATAQVGMTWAGSVDKTWENGSNWTGGGGRYPGQGTSYTDYVANIPNTPAILPISLSTTELLGGTTTVVTIAAGTTGTNVALDITGAGTLGLQGGLSIGNRKIIQVEGVLRHDGSTGTHYTVGGGATASSVNLVGGTVSSLNGGIWDLSRPIQGYGTISAPFQASGASMVNANVSGQTLHVTGPCTISGGLTASLTSGTAGAILSLESTVTSGGTGGSIAHTGEVDLNGATLIGSSSSAHININNTSGPVNLTGACTFEGWVDIGSNGAFNLNGHTITLAYDALNNPPTLGIISAVTVGTGTIDNATSADLDFSQGPYNFAGGSLTSTGGGAFIRGGIYGWGTLSAPLIPIGSAAIVNANSSGHTLYITNSVIMTNSSSNGNLIASNSGILELAAGSILTTTGPSSFTGYVSPGTNGIVNLNGTNIVGGTSPIRLNTGTMNVTGDSTLGGPIDCASNLTINSGKTLSITGGTATVSFSAGSLTNNGTFAVGAGTATNGTANPYAISGSGSITLAGGSITSAGGGGFTSNNTLLGYGTVSASYTNGGKVVADGNGTEHTLDMHAVTPVANTGGMGWFAQNHGETLLPSITVSGAGAYNWGGDPTALGMVNSVGMNFGGSFTPGTLSIALLSPDRADVAAGLVAPIGVWQFTPGGLAGTMDLTFRYDDVAVGGGDQSCLQLVENSGSGWESVPCTVDTANKLVTAGGLTVPSGTVLLAIEPSPTTPTATCQSITVSVTGSPATVAAADIDGGSTAACGASISTLEIAPGDQTADCASSGAFGPTVDFACGDAGVQTVTLRVTQSDGQKACCVTTVTVQCVQPSGSCCATDGTCTMTTEAECTGTWTQDGICDPNPCPCPLMGDLNGDGVVNGLDIEDFVDCVLGGGTNCRCGDFEHNGAIDLADVPGFVAALLP